MQKFGFFIVAFMLVLLTGCSGYFGPGMADYSYSLSDEYKLSHAGESSIVDKDGNFVINRNISGIAWDSEFILAEQVSDKKTSFWIICLKNNNISGPLSKEEYENKKTELNISKKLTLESPDKYKKLDEAKKKL